MHIKNAKRAYISFQEMNMRRMIKIKFSIENIRVIFKYGTLDDDGQRNVRFPVKS